VWESLRSYFIACVRLSLFIGLAGPFPFARALVCACFLRIIVFLRARVFAHRSFLQAVGNIFAFGLNDTVKAKWREVWLEMQATRSLLRPLCNVDARAAADGEDDFVCDDQAGGNGHGLEAASVRPSNFELYLATVTQSEDEINTA